MFLFRETEIVIMNLNYLEVIESSLSLLVYRNSSIIFLSFHEKLERTKYF